MNLRTTSLDPLSRLVLLPLLIILLSGSSVMVVYAAKPVVTTMPPQNVTSTSAELYGTVNPKGKLTTWKFVGLVSDPPVPLLWCSGAGPLQPVDNTFTVHCTVQNLTPETTYRYYVQATNVDGTSNGSPVQLRTSAAGSKPDVQILPPIDVTDNSAYVRGSVNPNGRPTTWTIHGGLYPGGENVVCPEAALPPSFDWVEVGCTWSNLSPSTEYAYSLQARNDLGYDASAFFDFWTLAGVGSTDWAMLSAGMTPASPHIGDSVIFHASITVVSTTRSYPQSVGVECSINGVSCGSGQVDFPGPTGAMGTVSSEAPWPATAGTHTLTWRVYGAFNDPNPQNDIVTTRFTVEAAGASTQTVTTQSSSTVQLTTSAPTQPVTTQTQQPPQTITTAETVVQTVTQTQDATGGFFEMLQANSLPIMGLLALLVILAVVFSLRTRSAGYQFPTHTPAGAHPMGEPLFCGHCGSRNPSTSEYCAKCGSKLLKLP